MRGQRFQFQTPTLAILSQDGRRTPVTIPAGAIVEVMAGPLSGNRIIKWDGKTVKTFAIDLRERGVPMQQTR